jgi:hypothetical protein
MPTAEDVTEMPAMPPGAPVMALVMESRRARYAGAGVAECMARMLGRGLYSSTMLQALEAQLTAGGQGETAVPLDRLQPGMVLSRAVTGNRDGRDMTLVPEGYELSRTTIVFLRQTARNGRVDEPVMVRGDSVTVRPSARAEG